MHRRHATPSPHPTTPPTPAWKNKSAAVMRPLILTNVIAYIINFFWGGIYTGGTFAGRPAQISISDGGPTWDNNQRHNGGDLAA